MPAGIEERLISRVGRPKVCVVQDVEELSTELHIEPFRDSRDVVVLDTETSRFSSPGPTTLFRPAFPRSVAGLGNVKQFKFT